MRNGETQSRPRVPALPVSGWTRPPVEPQGSRRVLVGVTGAGSRVRPRRGAILPRVERRDSSDCRSKARSGARGNRRANARVHGSPDLR